jgi:hypothetical protein
MTDQLTNLDAFVAGVVGVLVFWWVVSSFRNADRDR